MKKVVISLGGSVIMPDRIDVKFLVALKHLLRKYYDLYQFVVVCGGGTLARQYIGLLKQQKSTEEELSRAGIQATRINAEYLMHFFHGDANEHLPLTMIAVKNALRKNKIVFCGGLRYTSHSTSDGTAARLAHYLIAPFINITDVKGLYTSDPKKHATAKLIPRITWHDFEKLTKKHAYKPGMHFILDGKAAAIIKKYKMPTHIIGKELEELQHLLDNKPYIGTIIEQ